MLISVTKEDIRNGYRGKEINCPIALACKRAFNTKDVIIDEDFAQINGENYIMPLEASDFVASFDDEEHVDPIEFELY